MAGAVHHVATRSDTLPSKEETICQAGTFRRDGFEMRMMPEESTSFVATFLVDFDPSDATRS
jgi:hypothetical protein